MTRTGHRVTGFGAAAISFSIAHTHHGMPWLAAALAFLGVTAPDWLEIAWFSKGVRHSIIQHRTVTHWLLLWCGLYGLAFLSLQQEPWASALLGFAVGGLTHLVMDLPNPSGIHLLHPYRQRASLNWWRGDQMVGVMVLLSWLAGAMSLHWAGLVTLRLPPHMEALFRSGYAWVVGVLHA